MIVLGIDPGTAALGYGIIDRTGGRLRAIDHGAFHTSADLTLPERLLAIHSFLLDLIELHGPALLGVERIFHSRNVQTALAVGHARGVVLLAAAEHHPERSAATPAVARVAGTGYRPADQPRRGGAVRRRPRPPALAESRSPASSDRARPSSLAGAPSAAGWAACTPSTTRI